MIFKSSNTFAINISFSEAGLEEVKEEAKESPDKYVSSEPSSSSDLENESDDSANEKDSGKEHEMELEQKKEKERSSQIILLTV